MSNRQDVTIVHNHNGCCGGCGCGTFISVIILMGLFGYLAEEHGPIVGLIVGTSTGAWGGAKLSGCTIDELNTINTENMDNRQKRGLAMAGIGAILGAFGGWGIGTELQKEMQDNARILLQLLSRHHA